MNKKLISSIVGLVVIAALITGGVYYYQKNYAPPKNLITSKDPGLTEAEKQNSIKIISDDQAKLVASASNEDKYRLYLAIGAENFRIGKLQESLDAYLAASELLPDNSVPWGEAAKVAFNMNNFRDAKKYIDKALQLNPTSQDFKNLLQKIEDKIKTA